jgi:small subunit ribosomal protein S21
MHSSTVIVTGDIDEAIRSLRKFYAASGLLRELRQRSYFETKSQKRKRKLEASRRRLRRTQKKKEANDAKRQAGKC